MVTMINKKRNLFGVAEYRLKLTSCTKLLGVAHSQQSAVSSSVAVTVQFAKSLLKKLLRVRTALCNNNQKVAWYVQDSFALSNTAINTTTRLVLAKSSEVMLGQISTDIVIFLLRFNGDTRYLTHTIEIHHLSLGNDFSSVNLNLSLKKYRMKYIN